MRTVYQVHANRRKAIHRTTGGKCEEITSRPYHGATQFVHPGPRCFVAAQTQHLSQHRFTQQFLPPHLLNDSVNLLHPPVESEEQTCRSSGYLRSTPPGAVSVTPFADRYTGFPVMRITPSRYSFHLLRGIS